MNSPADILDIGLSDAPPFVILKDGAPPTGLSVELWRRVEMNLIADGHITGSRYIRCDALEDINTALEQGSLDIALTPLTMTPERLEIHDMSRQYFLSGLTVATIFSGEIAFGRALDVLVSTLFRPGTMQAITLFLILNLLLAFLIHWILRDARERSNENLAAGNGVVMAFVDPYFDAVERTLGLKGLDEASYNFAGRILEIFMAIIGAVLSAALLGVLTSAFVSAIGHTDHLETKDLLSLRLGVVAGSTAEEFLESSVNQNGGATDLCKPLEDTNGQDPGCRTTQTVILLADALAAGTIDVVLGDWAELTFLSRVGSSANDIQVQDFVYRNEPLGWGYGKNMTVLSAQIDSALIEKIRDPDWRHQVQQHIGSGSISPD